MHQYILRLQCPDKPGILHTITQAILAIQGNIIQADQYTSDDAQFFTRIHYATQSAATYDCDRIVTILRNELSAIAHCLPISRPLNVAIMVSKSDHCLQEILYQWRTKALPITIQSIISNHKNSEDLARTHHIPFHYLSDPAKSDDTVLSHTRNTDGIILARYMQVLSGYFLQQYNKPVINIHHSFLPSFPGARPYHQAHERGVKLIGATAHFATETLDDGPIIAQKVAPITHRDTVHDLKTIGQQLEKQCLVQAIQLVASHRVSTHNGKTIIF
jgi:formyltetrahydrofolate deformylase